MNKKVKALAGHQYLSLRLCKVKHFFRILIRNGKRLFAKDICPVGQRSAFPFPEEGAVKSRRQDDRASHGTF